MLAFKYDVQILMNECERCLKFAHEISVVDRLILADKLGLNDLKVF